MKYLSGRNIGIFFTLVGFPLALVLSLPYSMHTGLQIGAVVSFAGILLIGHGFTSLSKGRRVFAIGCLTIIAAFVAGLYVAGLTGSWHRASVVGLYLIVLGLAEIVISPLVALHAKIKH